jgi:gas vesicle protein
MAESNQKNRKLPIAALAAGIAGFAGYLTGILTAPKSGKETRDDITGKVTDVKEGTTEQLQRLNDELKDLIKDTKTRTIALSSQAREEFNEAVVKAKDAQNKATTVLKAVKSGKAEDPQLSKAIKQAKQAQKNLAKYLKGEQS